MKKLLALVLALVMTLCLCVTSNAAYDGEEFDYATAVEVMTKLGVFQGDENGKFNPTGILTREQAAKIVTYMILGKTAADALVTIAAPFADVAADRWSAGSIAYCYNEGILAGVGNGMFAPTAELTGLAFAKMMLTALGYDAEVEGLTGSQWSINAAKLALTVGLTDGMDDVALSAPMTREQAAQMALNTELATMVEYPNASVVKVGNVEVTTSAKASDVYAADATTFNSSESYLGKYTLQFAEKYAKNLSSNTVFFDGLQGSKYAYKSENFTSWSMSGKILATVTDGTDFADLVNESNKDYVGYKMDDAATLYVNGDLVSSYSTVTALATSADTTYDRRGVVVKF